MIHQVLIAIFLLGLVLIFWYKEKINHCASIKNIKIRVHVNGTRGKSTVTRLLGSILTEAGYRTFVKTTGSDTRLILPDRKEKQIFRFKASIDEQIKIINLITSFEPDAIVFECMAVRPAYQKICEEEIIKANIGVITNVRSDHQDLMGETLEEMALSLSNMMPTSGTVITGDIPEDLMKIILAQARKKNTQVISSKKYKELIPPDYISKFDYLAHEENIAIGLAFCDILGIDIEIGLKGILKAKPDPGALKFYKKKIEKNKEVLFINLHAINDKESTISTYKILEERGFIKKDDIKIGVLNHRKDRAFRIEMFSDICINDLDLDYILCIGDLQEIAEKDLIKKGFDKKNIVKIKNNKLDTFLRLLKNIIIKKGVVIGMVNIHGKLSDEYIPYFQGKKEEIDIIAP